MEGKAVFDWGGEGKTPASYSEDLAPLGFCEHHRSSGSSEEMKSFSLFAKGGGVAHIRWRTQRALIRLRVLYQAEPG